MNTYRTRKLIKKHFTLILLLEFVNFWEELLLDQLLINLDKLLLPQYLILYFSPLLFPVLSPIIKKVTQYALLLEAYGNLIFKGVKITNYNLSFFWGENR